MMQKAWHIIEEVPYYFFRSSIKFPGHMGPKINNLNPILSKNTRLVATIKSLRFALFFKQGSMYEPFICYKSKQSTLKPDGIGLEIRYVFLHTESQHAA